MLRVEHVIVCGHYGCSGVSAALRRERVGLADNWLRHVQDVCDKHERILGGITDENLKANRLCELNVIEQVSNLAQTTVMQDAWGRGQEVTVYYDARRPDRAVLQPGGARRAAFVLIAGLGLLMLWHRVRLT